MASRMLAIALLPARYNLLPWELSELDYQQRVARACGPSRRLIYDTKYKIQRRIAPWRWSRWPADPRNELEKAMHVNEQSRTSLRASLQRAGFADVNVTHGEWIYTDFVPSPKAARTYSRLGRFHATEAFGRANIFAEASNP